jgi:DNA invertase Pin-like site-specific DNA recombinase
MTENKRVALYVRVSTTGQNVENQLKDLQEVAKRHNWEIVETYTDKGISGAKGRDKRPGFDALNKAITRREIDLVAAWSVDRLGRSLQDLISFLGEIKEKGVDLYLHKQGLDTSTSSGKAMFGMLGVFSEFERDIIRERVCAGLEVAKAKGKRLGRPRVVTPSKLKTIQEMKAEGASLRIIAAKTKLGLGTVSRALNN